jgi:hypothetical protein
MEYHFDLTVSGIDPDDAELLLSEFIHRAEGLGGSVGGGVTPVQEGDDDYEDEDTDPLDEDPA